MKNEKKTVRYPFVLIGILILPFMASAGLISYDGFGYVESPLGYQDGGIGWIGGWAKGYSATSTPPGSDVQIFTERNLATDEFLYNGSQGSAYINASSAGDQMERLFAKPISLSSDNTYYLSFLFNRNVNKYAVIKLCYGGIGTKSYDRIRFVLTGGMAQANIYNNGSYGTNVSSDVIYGSSETCLFVARIKAHSDVANEVSVKVYTSGDIIDVNEDDVSWNVTTSGVCNDMLGTFGVITGDSSGLYIDELRLASDWQDAVPYANIPEMGTELIAYDSFAYSTETIANNNGGQGWSGSWYGTSDLDNDAHLTGESSIAITPMSMLDPNDIAPGGSIFNVGDRVSDEMVALRYLPVDSNIDLNQDNTFYLSFYIRREDLGGLSGGEFAAIKFFNKTSTTLNPLLAVGTSSREQFELSVYDEASSEIIITQGAPGDFELNETYFMVAKISTMDNTSGNYDMIYLKAYKIGEDNISSSEPTQWDLQSTMFANADQPIDVIGIILGKYATVMLDEIKLGKTWQSVINTIDICGADGVGYIGGDINQDCSVNIYDFAVLAENWLK